MLQLLVLAVVTMIGVALLRLARVQLGRSPLPSGRGRFVFLVALVVVPPAVLGALIHPTAGDSPLRGPAWVFLFGMMLAGLAILMAIAADVVERKAHARSRRLLLIALVGRDGAWDAALPDPPVTSELAESMVLVDRTNAEFPRGLAFPAQVDRADFQPAWEALDAATRTLEGQIAEDHRLGLGVASAAATTAADARVRLDMLRRIADSRGPAVAV
jgi:hypothetical protein